MATVRVDVGQDSDELGGAKTRLLIGRTAQCDLHVEDATVSRRHAEIYLEDGQTWIRDLGSSNGTWVDGEAIERESVALQPGQEVLVGKVPVRLEWTGGGRDTGATQMVAEISPKMLAAIEARRQHQQAAAQVRPAPSKAAFAPLGGEVGTGGSATPDAAHFPYRCQGSNSNGVLLIALRKDSFVNGDTLDGYVEFTAMDNETVASITIELVECHEDGPRKGHVWDRMLVRQGPWRADKGDTVPMPFSLRVPPGTSISGRNCNWELRGYVDIEWAADIEGKAPITMRNKDIERLRDALGALDYRVNEIVSSPLGQRFRGSFQPPANRISKLGITDIHLVLEYLGLNLEMTLTVEKSSWFKADKKSQAIFDLQQLRTAPLPEISAHFERSIAALMD